MKLFMYVIVLELIWQGQALFTYRSMKYLRIIIMISRIIIKNSAKQYRKVQTQVFKRPSRTRD